MIIKYESSNHSHGILHPHLSHAQPFLSKCMCARGHTFCASLFFNKNPNSMRVCVSIQNCVCLNKLVNNQLVL